jgi:hypothetical protein
LEATQDSAQVLFGAARTQVLRASMLAKANPAGWPSSDGTFVNEPRLTSEAANRFRVFITASIG